MPSSPYWGRGFVRPAAMLLSVLILAACGGGGGSDGPTVQNPPLEAQASQLCGYEVGAQRLTGLVISVHDGDTLRLRANGTEHSVRLDGIDAPELSQAFGPQSQAALSAQVLNQSVQVAYDKTDRYGRIVGAVFTQNCEYANLRQVQAGLAWVYRAYQCELALATRAAFALAEDQAQQGALGLWAQGAPVAPWIYRNGVDPAVPTCASQG